MVDNRSVHIADEHVHKLMDARSARDRKDSLTTWIGIALAAAFILLLAKIIFDAMQQGVS